ncbi:MAG: hypothetical protein IPO00_10680 [Betaproteobacteria bacterium]|nr:hypothetical protein [Betaproteobacteria bacterium]
MGGGSAEATLLIANAATIQSEANATIGSNAGSFTAVTLTATVVIQRSIATLRVTAGAAMNNAQYTIQAKQASYEGQMAKKGRIMDADFAAETANLARFQILQQAGMAMVAQANAIPSNVLALLR